jgi:hypothetical protein
MRILDEEGRELTIAVGGDAFIVDRMAGEPTQAQGGKKPARSWSTSVHHPRAFAH